MPSELGKSKLFEPLTIGNGTLTLSHRVVHAPLTRNRGAPLVADKPEKPNRVWVADEVVREYYSQRATPGGLLISEGIHPSLEAGGTPGVPGLFVPEHVQGWKTVVDGVHAKGAYFYAQLWHAGRTTMPNLTGMLSVSSSVAVWPNDEVYPWGGLKKKDHPPRELSKDDIKSTIADFANAAKMAVEAGFDGIEIHGANGYLPEQFLHSNINHRTDEYGGSIENRCRFVLELLEAIISAVGEDKTAIRFSPFGLFNQARGTQRLETWSYLCREIKKCWSLSYIHFVEPRFEQIESFEEKDKFLKEWGLEGITLQPFRAIMGDTPLFSAGGYNDKNSLGVIESGACDALVYGRFFLSNPDFVERMREGLPLNPYNRALFYGPLDVREEGYTDYPAWAEVEETMKSKATAAA